MSICEKCGCDINDGAGCSNPKCLEVWYEEVQSRISLSGFDDVTDQEVYSVMRDGISLSVNDIADIVAGTEPPEAQEPEPEIAGKVSDLIEHYDKQEPEHGHIDMPVAFLDEAESHVVFLPQDEDAPILLSTAINHRDFIGYVFDDGNGNYLCKQSCRDCHGELCIAVRFKRAK
jgi:hypothetical protein